MHLSVLVAAAALLSPVRSIAIPRLGFRDVGIDVDLESLGDAQVKVTVTNNADHDISVLKLNSFFDESPIQKVNVYKDGSEDELPFHGIQPRYDLEHLTPDNFTPLAPGATISSEFDIAETLDLSSGGTYTISSQGVFLIGSGTNPNSSSITGVAPYKSNTLTLHLNASDIAARSPPLLSRRAALENDTCSGTPQGKALQSALRNAALLSLQSSVAARLGPPQKFHEYFRTTDPKTRQSISSRFAAIAQEASAQSTPSSGANDAKITYHCTDPLSYCRDGILAYAIPLRNIIVNCPWYYRLPALTQRCHGQDQATTTLHEFTHVSALYRPHTVDHAYGYEASVALEADEAVRNADSFALFANDLALGC